MSQDGPDGGAFFAGMFFGAVLALFAISGLGLLDFNHWVGATQGVCMAIADDESRQYRACATGEELIDYLRQREGISR